MRGPNLSVTVSIKDSTNFQNLDNLIICCFNFGSVAMHVYLNYITMLNTEKICQLLMSVRTRNY